MSSEERLIRYCRIDTQSDPAHEDVTPSTAKQFDLARVLETELKELGLEDVTLDEHCYVYGRLPANTEKNVKTVGFIAHMDTAPDFSGTNVNPRIIENFDGNDIALNPEVTLKMEDFPWMRELKGKRLMVTDGTTLLGADDKAGIVSIMEALVWLKEHPEFKHGAISVGFTPDEEIGNGPKYFDVKKFNADFAYTMDGGTVRELADETFNAASALVTFKGFSIHPGEAKDRMINAALAAVKFAAMLPAHEVPEHTEGREGFIHLHNMEGDCESAKLSYILRDHDGAKLEEKKELIRKTADYINAMYGTEVCTCTLRDSYRNMKEVLDQHPQAVDTARAVMEELGLQVLNTPVRGGTDGSQITFMGLPCPNLGCGGGNFHGRYEYCVMEELEMAREVILGIIRHTAEAEA
ncbi:MAG: peptidase T [Solobacterium sp.]|nr:peptidase T [Solobacterium sp.]